MPPIEEPAPLNRSTKANADSSTKLDAYGLMLLAMVAFAVMSILIRMAGEHLPPLMIVFFRNFFALLMFTPLVIRAGWSIFQTRQLGLHLLRGANGLAAMSCYFTALTLAPLAEVTAIGFATPLFATIGAALFLGERLRSRRMAALFAGFVGVLLVLWPSLGAESLSAASSLGAALSLVAAALIGCSVVLVKQLTKTDAPSQIAFWMVLVQTPLSLGPALYVWETPSWTALGLMVAVAAAGSVGHLAWTNASSRAEVSSLQPLEFVRLPLVAALAYVLFDQQPTIWTWIGGGVIFVSTTYITWREAQLNRGAASTVKT